MRTQGLDFLAGILVLIGIAFLLDNYGILRGILEFWPIIPLIIGIGFCMLFFKNKKKDIVLLGIGSLVSLYSIFFIYLNFNSWAELAYLWPVFIVLMGVMFCVLYSQSKEKVILYIGIFLVSIGVSFILVFAVSTRLWPITVVLGGISLFIISIFERRK